MTSTVINNTYAYQLCVLISNEKRYNHDKPAQNQSSYMSQVACFLDAQMIKSKNLRSGVHLRCILFCSFTKEMLGKIDLETGKVTNVYM